ncbi:hypothetical protein GLAREA_09672 [Glarea lozoyensis ATCC 20868]|uniref:Uncharacterized protein n=1 Tax=Glarea lozoyensis (strain ATCC 20868 / MF5171) TaxID=1116229 RepID=S3D974_GLAL2|nr:uncharacterized protein GLAREA_09672 [Glarea lozoyensis ATCC 20868]EPE28551.1 hypothetical protein GLAREA_09672 [Glarea lozoyensis ATCC 20868]
MPPPVTPSPHRFVVKKQQPLSHKKTTLNQEYRPRPPPPPPPSSTPRHAPPSSTPQFNSTPRFHLPSTPRPSATPGPRVSTPNPQGSYGGPTPSASRYRTSARKEVKAEDAINSSFDEDIQNSIESEEEGQENWVDENPEDDYNIDPRSPKRQRVSPSPTPSPFEPLFEPSSSASLPILSSPPQAPIKRALPVAASRFMTTVLGASQQSTYLTQGQQAFRKPPTFRPPSPSAPQNQLDPLPEQFSPHGKGRKYIPGGLAAELQSWLFNIESTSHTVSRSKNEEWPIRIIVDEISGHPRSGMTMISGRRIHDMESNDDGPSGIIDTLGEVRVILAGEGQLSGLQRGSKVEKGRVIGIKGPVWEVVLEDGKWSVGCDWKVLDDKEYG